MQKERILGICVCDLKPDESQAAFTKDLKKGKKIFIAAVNPEKILKARKDKRLAEILEAADYAIPDGIGVVLASRIKKGNIKQRFTGIDCMESICAFSGGLDLKIFLYGASESSVTGAAHALKAKYPNINIVGCINGYETDNNKVIEKINESRADILFVSLGSPKQEYWISDNKDLLCCKLFMGVGGSFDVLSGEKKRAPLKMQNAGLEWLYRLIKEPKRILRQIKLIKFVTLALFRKE